MHQTIGKELAASALAVIAATMLGIFIAAAVAIFRVNAEPAMPQIKAGGQCPSGYSQSGAYCNPANANAARSIPKVGQCPSGWTQSGAYCVEMKKR